MKKELKMRAKEGRIGVKHNEALKAILQTMLSKRCIGKHTPEELIRSKTKWLEADKVENLRRDISKS